KLVGLSTKSVGLSTKLVGLSTKLVGLSSMLVGLRTRPVDLPIESAGFRPERAVNRLIRADRGPFLIAEITDKGCRTGPARPRSADLSLISIYFRRRFRY